MRYGLLLIFCACSAPPAHDPLEAARTRTRVDNLEANVPPQCYAITRGGANTCWTCHTDPHGDNLADDFELQREYDFSELARSNHWKNSFLDLAEEARAISDEEILAWVRTDNYAWLRSALARLPHGKVWVPDLDLSRGFDEEGFARDGSGWRAYRYKPFLGMGFPTNGNTGDAFIRLPELFRRNSAGRIDRRIEKENLAIVEAAIAEGADRLPRTYAGAAAGVRVEPERFPAGTEIIHSVRYLDPAAPSFRALRMKELRYMRKDRLLDDWALTYAYGEERDEKDEGLLPKFSGTAELGFSSDYGWVLTGYIEDERGALRLQTAEEQRFCMGCHGTLGITVDSTFSFARKVPGDAGWAEQDLRGMKDVPQRGHAQPEILTYLVRARRADDFGVNEEMSARFFPGGVLDEAAVRRAAKGGDRDLAWLLAPSSERALSLNKTYLALVRWQRFELGREALGGKAQVLAEIVDRSTHLEEAGALYRDASLRLIW